MAATKLGLFNAALGHLGERRLADLAEQREPRRVLDDYYNDVVAHCLEMGAWKFALRGMKLAASASVMPEFGFAHSVRKPDDWMRTILVAENENFEPPLLRFREEQGRWHADGHTLYVRYVSNHPTFGGDLSRWPQLFGDYVALRLAAQACTRITGSESKAESVRRQERKALAAAREHNAAGDAPQFAPGGTWSRARGAASVSRWDRQSF